MKGRDKSLYLTECLATQNNPELTGGLGKLQETRYTCI